MAQRLTIWLSFCTNLLHQPSLHTFELFDSLIVLGKGGVLLYNGPASQCASYLENVLHINVTKWDTPADQLMQIATAENGNWSTYALAKIWSAQSPSEAWHWQNQENRCFSLQNADRSQNPSTLESILPSRAPPHSHSLIPLHAYRSFILWWRGAGLIAFLCTIFITPFLGWFGRSQNNATEDVIVANIPLSLTIITFFSSLVATIDGLQYFGSAREVFIREASAGMSILAYFCGTVLFSTIIAALTAFAETFLFRISSSPLRHPSNSFPWLGWFIILFIGRLTSQGIGMLISVLVNPELGISIAIIFVFLSLLFSGRILPYSTMQVKHMILLYYISPAHQIHEALTRQELGQCTSLREGHPSCGLCARCFTYQAAEYPLNRRSLQTTWLLLATLVLVFSLAYANISSHDLRTPSFAQTFTISTAAYTLMVSLCSSLASLFVSVALIAPIFRGYFHHIPRRIKLQWDSLTLTSRIRLPIPSLVLFGRQPDIALVFFRSLCLANCCSHLAVYLALFSGSPISTIPGLITGLVCGISLVCMFVFCTTSFSGIRGDLRDIIDAGNTDHDNRFREVMAKLATQDGFTAVNQFTALDFISFKAYTAGGRGPAIIPTLLANDEPYLISFIRQALNIR